MDFDNTWRFLSLQQQPFDPQYSRRVCELTFREPIFLLESDGLWVYVRWVLVIGLTFLGIVQFLKLFLESELDRTGKGTLKCFGVLIKLYSFLLEYDLPILEFHKWPDRRCYAQVV